MFESDPDPRLTDEHVREVELRGARITAVGVVHDHPASAHRAREVVSRCDPATLALELPPLAVPLFREYARDSRTPPAFGGEMSAAIQATETARIVGIDGPSRSFIRLLVRTLRREGATSDTVRDVIEAMGVATKTAVTSWAAGLLARATSLRLEVGEPWTYAVDRTDDPTAQAADEREHLDRAWALSSSLIPPAAKRIRDEVREEHMADRLREAAGDGDVVAVVGRDHLDAVVDELTAE